MVLGRVEFIDLNQESGPILNFYETPHYSLKKDYALAHLYLCCPDGQSHISNLCITLWECIEQNTDYKTISDKGST